MRPGPGIFLSEYLEQRVPASITSALTPSVEEDTQLLLSNGCNLMFDKVNGRTVEIPG